MIHSTRLTWKRDLRRRWSGFIRVLLKDFDWHWAAATFLKTPSLASNRSSHLDRRTGPLIVTDQVTLTYDGFREWRHCCWSYWVEAMGLSRWLWWGSLSWQWTHTAAILIVTSACHTHTHTQNSTITHTHTHTHTHTLQIAQSAAQWQWSWLESEDGHGPKHS